MTMAQTPQARWRNLAPGGRAAGGGSSAPSRFGYRCSRNVDCRVLAERRASVSGPCSPTMRAKQLGENNARPRTESVALCEHRASNNGSSSSTNCPMSGPQVAPTC
jgi:hypothetical protein